MPIKKIIKPFLFFAIMLFATKSPAYSLATNTLSTLKQGHLVFQVGAYQSIAGEKQHINIQDLIGDTFTLDNRFDYGGVIGLGYFLEGQNVSRIKMNYGINGFYLSKIAVTGNVIQENLFTNLSYEYSLVNFPIYLMARSFVDLTVPNYSLIFDVGLGPNFMKAYHFREQSLDGVTIPDNPFTSHTTTTLSGTLGIALRKNHVFNQLPFECGYRFFYLGQGHLNISNDQVLNKLNTGKVYANALICSVSS